MKRILFSFALLFIAYRSMAVSEITVRIFNNTEFKFELDNYVYYSTNGVVSLSNVGSGVHKISVYKRVRIHNRLSEIVLYSGNVTINDERLVNFTIQRNNNILVNEQKHGNNEVYAPQTHLVDFGKLKIAVLNARNEHVRFLIIHDAFIENKFTSIQVLELLNTMTFENSRLELAKLAYNNVIDSQNYAVVNKAFLYMKSIDELKRFILHHH